MSQQEALSNPTATLELNAFSLGGVSDFDISDIYFTLTDSGQPHTFVSTFGARTVADFVESLRAILAGHPGNCKLQDMEMDTTRVRIAISNAKDSDAYTFKIECQGDTVGEGAHRATLAQEHVITHGQLTKFRNTLLKILWPDTGNER